MKIKDFKGIFSSFRPLIIRDYLTDDELKIYPACDYFRYGSPFENSDIRKTIERDNTIINDFGEYDVMRITCDLSCLYVEVVMGGD